MQNPQSRGGSPSRPPHRLIYFTSEIFFDIISCRIYPSQQSNIFDGVIDKQITPLNLSVDEDAAATKIGLQYAKGLLKKR